MDRTMDKFEFMGFDPDFDVKSAISRTLEKILGSAPSDAESVARLSRTREGFSGFIRLCSRQGTFVAEASGHDPIETVRHLTDRIHDQIRRWRLGRGIRTA